MCVCVCTWRDIESIPKYTVETYLRSRAISGFNQSPRVKCPARCKFSKDLAKEKHRHITLEPLTSLRT